MEHDSRHRAPPNVTVCPCTDKVPYGFRGQFLFPLGTPIRYGSSYFTWYPHPLTDFQRACIPPPNRHPFRLPSCARPGNHQSVPRSAPDHQFFLHKNPYGVSKSASNPQVANLWYPGSYCDTNVLAQSQFCPGKGLTRPPTNQKYCWR